MCIRDRGRGTLTRAIRRRGQHRQVHDSGPIATLVASILTISVAGVPAACDVVLAGLRGDVGTGSHALLSPAGSARRTLSVETPTAAAMARRLAPARRRPLMSAITAAVSRDGPLGPDLAGTSAAGPDPANALPQRRSVSGSTPNPAATCTALAALIRTSCTAAKRRHTWSSTSQAKASSPWRKTRPPLSSSTKAAAVPIRTASACGTRDRGRWAVITFVIPASPFAPKHRNDYLTQSTRRQAPALTHQRCPRG